MAFVDVMVDLETTGTDPSHTAILQLAAVAFNVETGDVSPALFNASLHMASTRRWDEDTRSWWSKRPMVLQSIRAKARPPAEVMQEFQDWVLKLLQTNNGEVRLWGKPISFEAPFLDSYFKEFGIHNPFNFRTHVDMRTYIRTRLDSWDISGWEADRKMQGIAHDALNDALHQVKLVLEATHAR